MSDKNKPDFSDVKSGNSSSAQPDFSNVQSGHSSTGQTRTYTVKAGDSLSKIALREYGDPSRWRQIYEANRDRIKDPDLIQPGWELKIPA